MLEGLTRPPYAYVRCIERFHYLEEGAVMKTATIQLLVVAANTATLLAGGYLTLLAFRAHRRTGASSLRALTVGLGCITAGTLLGGLLHQTGVAALLVGVTVQSVATALGFVVLAWSLSLPDDTAPEPTPLE